MKLFMVRLANVTPFSYGVLGRFFGKCFSVSPGAITLAAAYVFSSFAWAESTMMALDDNVLGGIAAQQGIAFDLEYRINTMADGSPVSSADCPTVGVLINGSSCRIAYSLADSSGMWIVAKQYRGLIKLINIRIDAAALDVAWSSRTSGTATGSGGNALYMNPNLCINVAGCTSASPVASYYDPRSKPSLQLTSGNWATAKAIGTADYNTYLNQPNYTDFSASLYVDRLTAEFDTGCTTSAGNTTCTARDGYLRDSVPGAPIKLRLSGGVGDIPAKVRLDGRLQIYGFGY